MLYILRNGLVGSVGLPLVIAYLAHASGQALAAPVDPYGVWINVGATRYQNSPVIYQTDNSGGATGVLQDSFSTGNVVHYQYTDPNTGDIITLSGTASASANLSTGELRAAGACPAGYCVATASYVDTVFLDLSNLVSLDPFDVHFDAYVHGTFSQGASNNFGLTFGSATAAVNYQTNSAADDTSSPEFFNVYSASGNFSVFGPDRFAGTITIDPSLVGTTSPFAFYVSMYLQGVSPFDFSNTAGLIFNSPVPYTSASGVFLTAVPNGVVPVPAALPLLASGLGALGFIGWRRKRKAALIAA